MRSPRFFKRSKYNAVKTEVDGIIFHSKKEAAYYKVLCQEMRDKKIDSFERQVKFELVPPQAGERAVNYIADFITYKDGKVMDVIDVKGMRLSDYVIKRKLLLWIFNIKIREV
jgi:hypothetical protein